MGSKYPCPVHGWDAVKMAENLTQAQLLELDRAVSNDPDNANPNYKRGDPNSSIYMLKKSARKKLESIGWAIYYQKQEGFYENME